MRILLFILTIIMIFFSLQRIYQPQLTYNSFSQRVQHPFDTRVRYRIGQIDPRFNISEQTLTTLTQQAADIWQTGTGEQHFQYDPNAQLSINLIFDQRQATFNAQQNQLNHLQQSKTQNDIYKQKIAELEQQLSQSAQHITLAKQNYQSQLDHHNQQVARYNQSSPQQRQDKQDLLQQQQYLNQQQQALQQQIDHFNLQVAQMNQQVDQFNQLNHQFNAAVDQFQTRFKPYQFDKGVFNGREINIYEFQNHDDLRLTLAHELGHALGLQHNQDPTALMYPILEQQNFQNFHLTTADLNLLKQSRRK